MTESVETIVVGGGVIGLAIARELALDGREVIVIEAEPVVGSGISARSSEVIHAGIYYPGGSLKARLCVAGKERLYQYCGRYGVEHKRLGKLIIATSKQELNRLQALLRQGQANGVTDLVSLSKSEIHNFEPSIRAEAAIYSPSTGIVDSHGLIHSLKGDLESAGAFVSVNTAFLAAKVRQKGFEVTTRGDTDYTLSCHTLINAAGLAAQTVAQKLIGFDPVLIPKQYLAKGNYFSLTGKHEFNHLVYPVPEIGGLGIHATLDLAGRVRFGPDVEWISTLDYAVDPGRVDRFASAIRTYWPDLGTDNLIPDYAGIRPKLTGPSESAADFVIQSKDLHGIANLIHLFGIESPGLTSSLAIAEYVRELLD